MYADMEKTNVVDVSECGEGYTGVLRTCLFLSFQKGQNRKSGGISLFEQSKSSKCFRTCYSNGGKNQ